MSLEDAIHRLTLARHREQLADVVVDFMRGYFGCGMFFLVRDGQARVWRGFASGIQEAAIETIAFPVSMPSCFQLAHDSSRLVPRPGPGRGQQAAAPDLEVPALRGTLRDRGGSGPGEKPRPQPGLCHAADGGPLPDGPLTDLQALCAAVSSTYVRMIPETESRGPGVEHARAVEIRSSSDGTRGLVDIQLL